MTTSFLSRITALFYLNKPAPKKDALFTDWPSTPVETPSFSTFNAFSGDSVSAQTSSDATSASAAALLWLGSTREAVPETPPPPSRLLTLVNSLFDTKATGAGQDNGALDWFFGAPVSLDATEGQGADLFSYFQGEGFSGEQESAASVEALPGSGLFELLRFVKAGAEPLPQVETLLDSFGTNGPAPLNTLGQPANLLFPGLLLKPAAV